MLYEIEHNYSQNLQLMSKCCTSKVILLVEKVKFLGTYTRKNNNMYTANLRQGCSPFGILLHWTQKVSNEMLGFWFKIIEKNCWEKSLMGNEGIQKW